MNNEYETKTCSLCGSPVITMPGQAAEKVCSCPEAQHRRDMDARFVRLKDAVENSCGEGCELSFPLHKPLTEEQLTAVVEIAEMVSYERIISAALVLPDGTDLKITSKKCERKATSKRAETI